MLLGIWGGFDVTDSGSIFALDLVRAGSMLTGLAADLVEDLPSDAFPGEDSAAVVIEMIIATIRTALGDVDDGELRRASELIGVACDRVLEHLRLALELRRRMEGTDEAWRSAS